MTDDDDQLDFDDEEATAEPDSDPSGMPLRVWLDGDGGVDLVVGAPNSTGRRTVSDAATGQTVGYIPGGVDGDEFHQRLEAFRNSHSDSAPAEEADQ